MKQIFKLNTISDGQPAIAVIKIEVTTKPHKQMDWITLEEIKDREVVSITGKLYENPIGKPDRKRLIGVGQIQSLITPTTDAQKSLIDFWNEYHLNDLVAGTKKQMDCLKQSHIKGGYLEECKFLEENGILIDTAASGRIYKYGCAWLTKEFPKDKLLTIIQELENEAA